jgi:hypothetical protein
MRFGLQAILLMLMLIGLLIGCGGEEPTATLPPATATDIPASPTEAVPTDLPATQPPAQTEAPTVAAVPTEVSTIPAEPTIAPTEVPAAPVPTTAPAAAAPAQEHFFGASTYGEILYNDEVRALATLGGVQMVRTSVSWANVEPTKGTYNWDSLDGTVRVLTENNFEPLVLILENPDWAANTKCGPVQDLAGFEAFLRELGTRYPQVRYWALYNEPDHAHGPENTSGGCFGGGDLDGNGQPDVNDYAEMLRIAWRALHQTNPQVRLVTGAVAFDNFDTETAPPGYPGGGNGGAGPSHFPEQLFQYIQAHPLPAGEQYFDDFGFNFYRIYGPYWQSQAAGVGVTAKINKLKGLMQQYGVPGGLMVSETGEDSVTVGTDEQSEFAVKTFTRGRAEGLDKMVWWTFQDFSDSNPAPSNTWKYGLIDQNANPKASFTAFQTMVNQLDGSSFVQALQVQGGEGYVFSKGPDVKAVVWSETDAPVTMAFSGSTLQVIDMYGVLKAVLDGSPEDSDSVPGRIGLQVGKFPVYVQVVGQ